MRILAPAFLLALAGTAAAQVPMEHWTHRGGPYHWLGIRPAESHIAMPGAGAVLCTRDQAERCASTPVFLMACKAPGPAAPAIPLHGSLHFVPLPGDPHALQALNPLHWPWFWQREPYFRREVRVTLAREDMPALRFPAMVTRERWAYNTDTDYLVAPLPHRRVADILARPGQAVLNIHGAGLRVRAAFDLSGRTGEFVRACGGEWKNER